MANVPTLLGTAPATLTTGTTYSLRLALAPNSQQLQVSTDGGNTYPTLVSSADSAVPFSGTVGVFGVGDNSTTGLQLRSFVANDNVRLLVEVLHAVANE